MNAPDHAEVIPPEAMGRLMVIEPPRRCVPLRLSEVWGHRDLLWMLVWREISANYRQSLIGWGWAIIKPALSMIVFTLIFGRVAKLGPAGTPYSIWNYAGLLPWLYFSGCVTAASTSVVSSGNLLTKVYFPRLILPLAGAARGLVDFTIQCVLLGMLMVWFRDEISPTWGLALVPVFVAFCGLAALSVSLWLAALNVRYRDVGHAVGFLVQIWMWLSPVVYTSEKIHESWRLLYSFNPMVGVIEGFRWATLGLQPPDWNMVRVSACVTGLLLIGGLYFFKRAENTFADTI